MLHSEKINKVLSPLTNTENTRFIKYISTEKIIKHYLNSFQIDVSDIFTNLKNVSLYKCIDTGYLFFYPYNIDGDSKFYESLQKIDWYYTDWKWEHEVAKRIINPNNKVLEIGCAKGSFLEKLNNIDCTGLEINQEAIKIAKEKGINVINETIQQHSINNKNKYDVVCSFQVIEHIADVYDAIKASIDCLADNGTLIISVPNNDSYLKMDFNILNMPPHHMGLWNEKSMKSLTDIFDLKLQQIHFEPMNKPTKYFEFVLTNYINNKFKVPAKLIQRAIPHLIPHLNKKFLAFTMLGQFKK